MTGASPVLAAHTMISPADQSLIEQQQKSLIEQAQQQRESLQNNAPLLAKPSSSPSHTDPTLCQRIFHIEITHSALITLSRRKALTTPWINRCLSLYDINALVRNITQDYLSQGYVTSRAWLPEQDISHGHLYIAITEGRIESITRNGKSSPTLKMAFPNMVGQVLNLRDLEQGLEQLNRLPSQPLTIDIQPGTKPGFSRVELVSSNKKSPLSLNASVDNSGQKSTGETQLTTSVTIDNPLGLADQWVFSASHDSKFRHDRRSRSLSGSVSLPYGYSLLSYLYSWSDFSQWIPFNGTQYPYTGHTQNHVLDVAHTLYRDGQQKLALGTSLTHRRIENRLAGERLSVSSPALSSLSASLNYSRTAAGGYLTFNPTYSRGIKALGSVDDDAHYPDMPRSEFRKYALSASYFYPLAPSLYFLTSAYGQTTPDNLYASERLSVGGQYSVRGFKEHYLTGNRGAYWRNELNWQWATLPWVGDVAITAAMDYGWVQPQKSLVDGGAVLGSALSLSIGERVWRQSISIGKPLKYPNTLNPDSWVAYWQASITL
ncbi:peptide transporter [Hafnia alvei]|nr:peptide transporter [Hafnia alvei]